MDEQEKPKEDSIRFQVAQGVYPNMVTSADIYDTREEAEQAIAATKDPEFYHIIETR